LTDVLELLAAWLTEAISSSKTSVRSYQTVRSNIPEDDGLQNKSTFKCSITIAAFKLLVIDNLLSDWIQFLLHNVRTERVLFYVVIKLIPFVCHRNPRFDFTAKELFYECYEHLSFLQLSPLIRDLKKLRVA
jgi:hypothetical protein